MRDSRYYAKIKLNKKQENEEKKVLDSIKECGDFIKLYEYNIDRDFNISIKELTATISEINKTNCGNTFSFSIGNYESVTSRDLNIVYYDSESLASYKAVTNFEIPVYFKMYSVINNKKIKEEFVNNAYKLLNETRDNVNAAINESYHIIEEVEEQIQTLLEKKKAKK